MESTQKSGKGGFIHRNLKSGEIFKWICIVATMILIFCIPGFLRFRDYCISKGYYVFSTESLYWTMLGFFITFGTRYGYYAIIRKTIEGLVNPKYEGEERLKKIDMLVKLSYDTIFYSATTLVSYAVFRREYWFPSLVGGSGSCSEIYKEYPSWPTDKRTELQAYFCFQLGVHAFLEFEICMFSHRTGRQFYEFMLHHTMAVSLILFSMMCNEIAAGVIILIIHDVSDIFMALARFFFEAMIPFKNMFTKGMVGMLMVFSWVYLRLTIFPFCLLSNVYINKPLPTDEWYIIYYEYMYLLTLAFILVGMHIYWAYFIIKSIFALYKKHDNPNYYDVHKKI